MPHKSNLLALLALAVVILIFATISVQADAILKCGPICGDLDRDGDIDFNDANQLTDIANGLRKDLCGDLNKDGRVDYQDILCMMVFLRVIDAPTTNYLSSNCPCLASQQMFINIPLKVGYNLISLPGTGELLRNDCPDPLYFWVYANNMWTLTQEVIGSMPEDEAKAWFSEFARTHAIFIDSSKDCTLKFELGRYTELNEISQLQVGFNFPPVTYNMPGMKMGDLFQSCSVTGYYYWDKTNQMWSFTDETHVFTESEKFTGFAVMANSTCGTTDHCGNGVCEPSLGENTASCPSDCPAEAVCGNGIKESSEQCDDGNTNNNDSCLNNCTNATCGDGYLRAGVEQCDDGNKVNGDGCSLTCKIEARCGNERLDPGEECDVGALNGFICIPPYGGSCFYCDASCKKITVQGPYCGDGACSKGETPQSCPSDCRLLRIESVEVPSGVGYFRVSGTQERFVPRGNNYVRLFGGYHSTFSPIYYNPSAVESALTQMENDGYNIVRVFIDPGGWYRNDGINGLDNTPGLDSAYMDNFADFVKRATNHGIYVMPSMDHIPFNDYYLGITQPWDPNIGAWNDMVLHKNYVDAKKAYLKDFINGLKDRVGSGMLTTIFAYELNNELFYSGRYAPFNSMDITVTTADGNTYWMGDTIQRQQCADNNVVYYANTLYDEVQKYDSGAMVTIGMFTFRAVNRDGPNGLLPISDPEVGEDRFPVRPDTLSKYSKLSFLDVHVYPYIYYTLYDDLVSSKWSEVSFKKPVIMAEMGAFNRYNFYPNLDDAVTALKNHQIESCNYHFSGWLLWTWDTVEQDYHDLWTALDGGGAINNVLAPKYRADPCKP